MRTTTIVIGAGQGGLAMSRCLSDRSIDHVVLERREVASSWRTERWDSLRLLTPSWQCRLPGFAYDGDDPDGFMAMPEVVELLTRYAKVIAAPVQAGTTVTSVRRIGDGYRVTTDQGEWECLTVVLACGAEEDVHHLAEGRRLAVVTLGREGAIAVEGKRVERARPGPASNLLPVRSRLSGGRAPSRSPLSAGRRTRAASTPPRSCRHRCTSRCRSIWPSNRTR